MASNSRASEQSGNRSQDSQQSIEVQMAVMVKRVGEVPYIVRKSPLYWESIELLAKDMMARGIFYALPNDCKLDYLKRKTNARNEIEHEW